MLSVDFFCRKPTKTKKTKLRTEIACHTAAVPPGRRQQIDGKGGRNVGLWSRYGG
jgi:hypothetical protein